MIKLSKQERTEYWHNHISNFVVSKKTQQQYCKDNNISHTKFKSWRYRFPNEFPANQEHPKSKQKKSKDLNTSNPVTNTINKFAAVEVMDACIDKQPTAQLTKLHLNKNIYLELPVGLDVNHLQKIFSALGVLQC